MTIARGLVFQAQKDPHSTFMMGLRGFANDKKGKKITPTNFKNNNKKKEKENNVIDFIDYLKNKRILNQ